MTILSLFMKNSIRWIIITVLPIMKMRIIKHLLLHDKDSMLILVLTLEMIQLSNTVLEWAWEIQRRSIIALLVVWGRIPPKLTKIEVPSKIISNHHHLSEFIHSIWRKVQKDLPIKMINLESFRHRDPRKRHFTYKSKQKLDNMLY
jgi:hypothetical protein